MQVATRCAVLHPFVKTGAVRRLPEHGLAEAVSLANALNLDVRFTETVQLRKIEARTLLGKGKVAQIKDRIQAADIEVVIVDAAVTPIQQRNLEKEWNAKVLDRTGLILEIFADRAQTREGVLQVDLAHLTYQKSRLVRSWTHLERQRGSTGTVGGPGETQIESDRRAIDDQIVKIKAQLGKIVKTRALHRAARKKVPYPIIALVGCTNAGKSTIFNKLTGADVLAKDMLFATLDPTMRAIALPSGKTAILSDTVGFISDLPTQLVAAFRATLEDVLDADLILHVRDISHPETVGQAADVEAILDRLGTSEKQKAGLIQVLNKIDGLPADAADALNRSVEREPRQIATSALLGTGMANLLQAIESSVAEPQTDETVHLSYAQGRHRAWLFGQSVIRSESATDAGYHIEVRWTERQRNQYFAL